MKISLTFDFDAMSVWLGSAGSTNPSAISRGEFGAVGLTRILAILKQRDLQATFFVPGHSALAWPKLVKQIIAEGHEIGHHGWVHENPAEFNENGEREILEKGLEALQKVAGVNPLGYRSPAWDFSTRTTQLLLEYDFVYDSSFMGDDFNPYYLRVGDKYSADSPYIYGQPVDLVELPVNWSLDDFPQFEFVFGTMQALNYPRQTEQYWCDEFDWANSQCSEGLFSLTLHPQVIGRGSRLAMLERLIDYYQEHGEFVRMIDYAMQWRNSMPLEHWLNGDSVHLGQLTQSEKY